MNLRHIMALFCLTLAATGCTATEMSSQSHLKKELRVMKRSFDDYVALNRANPTENLKVGIKEFKESFDDYLDTVAVEKDKEKEPRDILSKRPVDGRISSRFGLRKLKREKRARMHYGIDFAVPRGTPIAAAGPGVVTFVGWRGAYGKVVEIDHGEGLTTLYAHMDKQAVKRKQKISAGSTIGLSGNTGRSTGPHLHFEMRVSNKPLDPLEFLPLA